MVAEEDSGQISTTVGGRGEESRRYPDGHLLESADSLAASDSGSEGVEGVDGEAKGDVLGVDEDEVCEGGEEAEKVVPVVSGIDVAFFTGKDIAQLRSLNWCQNDEVVAMLTDALERGNDVIGVNGIDFLVNHDAVEDANFGNWL